MSDERWTSPLGTRYASPAMQLLWGEPHRVGLWRRLWLALAEAERELGLPITDEALAQMRAHLDDADLAAAARYERRFRHDVMAHVHAFADQAPAARPFLHLGATSAFVTDNADLVVMRDGLRLLLGRVVAVLSALEGFAGRTAHLPCLAYTHFQPAQLTTVGKRATLWMQDFGLDVEELCHRLDTLRFRGCQGATGTQASFLELFGGDDAKVRELERRVTGKLGFREQYAVTGQTYPRKADSAVLDTLSGIAQSAAKMAGDLRLLQHEGELLEPFEAEQIVGRSARDGLGDREAVAPDHLVEGLPVAAGRHAEHEPALAGHERHLLRDVPADDVLPHLEPGRDVGGEHQDRVGAEKRLGQGEPPVGAVVEGALEPLRGRRVGAVGLERDHVSGQAGDALRPHRVPLVGHGRRADLLLLERLLQFLPPL